MSRLFMGHKPGVGGVVKVMANDTDDPLTTPNEHYGKFLFNSETTKIGYVKYGTTTGYRNTGSGQRIYVPAGSNIDTAEKMINGSSTSGINRVYLLTENITGRSYPVATEHRVFKNLGVKNTTVNWKVYANFGYSILPYLNTTGSLIDFGGSLGIRPVSLIPPPRGVREEMFIDWVSSDSGGITHSVVYDLPIGDIPLPSGDAATPGSRAAYIGPTLVRISKSGSTMDGNDDGIIADSEKIPLRIIATGDVTIPPNSTHDIMSPVPLTSETVVDYIVGLDGFPITWPPAIGVTGAAAATLQAYVTSHTVFSDRVRIHNEGDYVKTVRYVITDANSQTTTGGSSVMRTLPDGHIQIKRPGSSDTEPLPGDIILDTYHPYLPIVKEGFISRDDFTLDSSRRAMGDRFCTIPLENDGSWVPFVKFYNSSPGISSGAFPTYGVLGPIQSGQQRFGWAQRYSSIAEITDDSVTFWLALTHPSGINSEGNYSYTGQGPYGIRYYIFAIPREFSV